MWLPKTQKDARSGPSLSWRSTPIGREFGAILRDSGDGIAAVIPQPPRICTRPVPRSAALPSGRHGVRHGVRSDWVATQVVRQICRSSCGRSDFWPVVM